MFSGITVELDASLAVGYVTFRKGTVDSTIALTSDVNLDLSSDGLPLGLELLQIPSQLPTDLLVEEFGLDREMLEILSGEILK